MQISRWRTPKPGWAGIAVFLFGCWLLMGASPGGPEFVSDDTCQDCHDDVTDVFDMTSHGTYLRGEAGPESGNCQSCHGPGGAHVESGEATDIINPANTDLIDGEMTCMSCHKGHAFENWSASNHRSGGVLCTDCHQVHVAMEDKPETRTSERCFDCHADVRAAGYMPSHHPIAEGKMECTDCHDVHGGAETFVQDGSVREGCFKCHGEMEGPFIFEHPPVTEDCTICHAPHGSVANNLLKQSEPTLCLSCHSMHFHAGLQSADGDFPPSPHAPDRAGESTPDGWKQVMLTKCTQCHSEIHGTDLPSQSISGKGSALTR